MRNILVILILSATAACSASGAGEPLQSSGNDSPDGGSLGGRRVFPADNPWNTDISAAPVDPNSATLIASCGLRNLHQDFGTTWQGVPNGIP